MKKIVLLSIATIMTAGIFAGCQKESSSTTAPSTNDSTQSVSDQNTAQNNAGIAATTQPNASLTPQSTNDSSIGSDDAAIQTQLKDLEQDSQNVDKALNDTPVQIPE